MPALLEREQALARCSRVALCPSRALCTGLRRLFELAAGQLTLLAQRLSVPACLRGSNLLPCLREPEPASSAAALLCAGVQLVPVRPHAIVNSLRRPVSTGALPLFHTGESSFPAAAQAASKGLATLACSGAAQKAMP